MSTERALGVAIIGARKQKILIRSLVIPVAPVGQGFGPICTDKPHKTFVLCLG